MDVGLIEGVGFGFLRVFDATTWGGVVVQGSRGLVFRDSHSLRPAFFFQGNFEARLMTDQLLTAANRREFVTILRLGLRTP